MRVAAPRPGGGSWGTAIRSDVARSRRDFGLLALKFFGSLTVVIGSTGVGTSTNVSRRSCRSSVTTAGDGVSPRPPLLAWTTTA